MRRQGPQQASFEAAMLSPTQHRLVKGRGYLHVGALPSLVTGAPGRCNPPLYTQSGSLHYLQPPQGGSPLVFIWTESGKAWVNLTADAKRLGFAPDYLSRNGWIYVRPVDHAVN